MTGMVESVIQPMHSIKCKRIIDGEQIFDIVTEKTRLAPPFKVYIYCTASKPYLNWHDGTIYLTHKDILGEQDCGVYQRLNRQVIGEYICDRIDEAQEQIILGGVYYSRHKGVIDEGLVCNSGLDNNELLALGKHKTLFVRHITNLKIYDRPKALQEFQDIRRVRRYRKKDYNKIQRLKHGTRLTFKRISNSIKHWCYISEIE